MNIGVVISTEKEATEFINVLEDQTEHQTGKYIIVEGRIEPHNVFVIVCGLGRDYAAAATQLLIDKIKPAFVLNTGFATSCHQEIKKGDIVCGTKFLYHDFDYKFAQTFSNEQEIAMSDKRLLVLAKNVCKQLELYYTEGIVVSGDRFSVKTSFKKAVSLKTECICADISSTSVANICAKNDVPFCAVKVVSDNFDNEDIDEIFISLNKYRFYSQQIITEMIKFAK